MHLCSLIICTRNRAESLRSTLGSIGQTVVPPWLKAELLVVDNGSTDDTAAVVKGCGINNMEVRYILEPRRGQCHARNAGIQGSSADIILFTDDDVRVPHDWLGGMCGPILRGEADAVQGGVTLAPDLVQPWMTTLHRSMMADTGRLEKGKPNELVGANMAFARRVLQKVHAFDTELGPGALGFGDDTLFSFQLREAGFRIRGAFDVAVEHHFNPDRLSRKALLSAAETNGRVWAYLQYHWFHETWARLTRRNFQLWRLRALRRPQRYPDRAPDWELLLITQVSFRRYFRRCERLGIPRKYARRSLCKLDGG